MERRKNHREKLEAITEKRKQYPGRSFLIKKNQSSGGVPLHEQAKIVLQLPATEGNVKGRAGLSPSHPIGWQYTGIPM